MGACRTLHALALAGAWLGASPPARAQPAPATSAPLKPEPPRAQAKPASVPLESIPAECGSRAAFDAALRERLGEQAPTSSVTLAIASAPNGYHLRVQLGDEQRELDDANCRELFRASIVIAVAMLLRDEERPPRATPAPPPSAPSAPRARPHARPAFVVGAGAGFNAGTLPKPVLALELEGKALWHYLGVSANVRYLVSAEERDANDQGANLRAFGAGVTGIFRPSHSWEARLGVAGQRLSGRGLGSNRRYQDSVWAAGPTWGLHFVPVEYGPMWAGIGAEGQLNLVRGHFEILNYSRDLTDPPHVIYEVPWLSGAAFVRWGLVW